MMKPFALAAFIGLLQLKFALTLRLRASSLSVRHGESAGANGGSAENADGHTAGLHRELGIPAKVAGNDGSPPSSFPLGECQGDCDNDSECAQGLVCYQRDSGSPLPPGCTGLSTDYSIDICAKPSSGSSSSRSGPGLKRRGNDGSPSNAFPLSLCEGDCDNDSECAGDLVCFQRRAYQAVPGCSGGASDSTPTDYCVESSTLGTSGGVPSSDFILRLYWEKGYNWQGVRTETKWCLKCMGSKCDQGDFLVIVDCDQDNPTPLKFVDYGSEFMIEIGGSQSSAGLCAELNMNTKNYELQKCDSGDALQRLTSGNGSHDGTGRFEMYPTSKSGFCLTQRHEPKYGEQLRAETCESARHSNTSFWNKY